MYFYPRLYQGVPYHHVTFFIYYRLLTTLDVLRRSEQYNAEVMHSI